MTGCGGAIAPLPGNAGAGLTLADSVSQAHYRLSVMDGAPVLTQVDGTSGVTADAGLVDSVTGVRYSVVVTRGALTLVPGGSAGASQIELNDTETAKAYALAVQSGALTLVQK